MLIILSIDLWRCIRAMLFCAAVVSLAACDWEIPTSIIISEGGPGPSFRMSGSGRLASFTVFAPRDGRRIAVGTPEFDSVVWQIKPKAGHLEGSGVWHLIVTYGVVPPGYNQTVPSGSNRPVGLNSGVLYGFFADTTGAAPAGGHFYMGNEGPIQIIVPDLGLKLVNGHQVEVNTRTSKPFTEPADLEKYVREHQ